MPKKTESLWFRILTVATYLLAALLLLCSVAGHTSFFASRWAAGGAGAMVSLLQSSFFRYEMIAVLVMVTDTVLFALAHKKSDFPSRLTIGTLIYNDLIFAAIVFLMYRYDGTGFYFPYPLVYSIPVITFVPSAVFLMDDWIHFPSGHKKREPRKTDSGKKNGEYADYIEEDTEKERKL